MWACGRAGRRGSVGKGSEWRMMDACMDWVFDIDDNDDDDDKRKRGGRGGDVL